MGGEIPSEPYRMMAGENLAYFVDRITEIKGSKFPIIICGDFNDEPFNRSITDYTKATREIERVKHANSKHLYNLMWDEMGRGKASFWYDGYPNMLDQFIVSKGLVVNNSEFIVKDGSVKVIDFEELKDSKGEPRKFGRPSSNLDIEEYSDHFPICMVLKER